MKNRDNSDVSISERNNQMRYRTHRCKVASTDFVNSNDVVQKIINFKNY